MSTHPWFSFFYYIAQQNGKKKSLLFAQLKRRLCSSLSFAFPSGFPEARVGGRGIYKTVVIDADTSD